jgi:hypothetical protein
MPRTMTQLFDHEHRGNLTNAECAFGFACHLSFPSGSLDCGIGV